MSEQELKLTTRQDVIDALQFASIVEHALCCEYLYAGFSVRRSLSDFPKTAVSTHKSYCQQTVDRVRPWLAQIYFIARQEMEHLGIVTNLLAALGEKPYLKRSQFPISRSGTLLDAPYCLERLSPMSLKTFIWFERPGYLTTSFSPDYLNRCPDIPSTAMSQVDVWASPSPDQVHEAAAKFDIHSVQALYEQIKLAFQTLPAIDLFQGDTQHQVGDIFAYRLRMKTVTNRVEAAAAVDLVVEQGEGIGLDPLTSDAHFQRFTQIWSEYQTAVSSPHFIDPALPSLLNPLVHPYRGQTIPENCYNCQPNLITREATRAVMSLFNDCYNLMLVMLYDFFGSYVSPNAPATPEPGSQSARYYAAFFPMMTMVIRPLGEILARIPAGEPYTNQNAGASFEIDNNLLDRWADMSKAERFDGYMMLLQRLAERADILAQRSEEIVAHEGEQVVLTPAELERRLTYLHQNLYSTRLHMHNLWQEVYR